MANEWNPRSPLPIFCTEEQIQDRWSYLVNASGKESFRAVAMRLAEEMRAVGYREAMTCDCGRMRSAPLCRVCDNDE